MAPNPATHIQMQPTSSGAASNLDALWSTIASGIALGAPFWLIATFLTL